MLSVDAEEGDPTTCVIFANPTKLEVCGLQKFEYGSERGQDSQEGLGCVCVWVDGDQVKDGEREEQRYAYMTLNLER